ncbi:MAG: hypothetical protein ABL984_13550 [Pyrinomonadaceae bacterium]
MPDLRPELTDDEKKFLGELTKICSAPRRKPSDTERCTLLKIRQTIEFDKMESERRAIAMADRFQRQLSDITYISARMNRLQNEGQLLSNALQRASNEYDLILTTRAHKPVSVFGEIAFTLFLTLLPELKLVGRAMKMFTDGRTVAAVVMNAGGASQDNPLARLLTELGNKTQKLADSNARIVRFADYLDNQSKDIIEAIRNPLVSAPEVDTESQKRLSAFNAKNQILTDLIKAIQRKLVLMTLMEPILYAFVIWYRGDDVRKVLESMFRTSGLDGDISSDGSEFDVFSDLILYNMLREYMTKYCWMQFGVSPANQIDGRKQFDERLTVFEGLDEAQRKMIFKRFGSKAWRPRPSFFSLDSNWDLARHLKLKTVTHAFGRKEIKINFYGPHPSRPISIDWGDDFDRIKF